jgi:hypothetical protein
MLTRRGWLFFSLNAEASNTDCINDFPERLRDDEFE